LFDYFKRKKYKDEIIDENKEEQKKLSTDEQVVVSMVLSDFENAKTVRQDSWKILDIA
jgi:hypothetical protein